MERAGDKLFNFLHVKLAAAQASPIALACLRLNLAYLAFSKVLRFAPHQTELSLWQSCFSVFAFACAICMFLGVFTRVSTILTGLILSWTYYFYSFGIMDAGLSIAASQSSNTLERDLLLHGIACILLGFSACNRVFSVDAYFRGGDARTDQADGEMMAVALMRALIISVYFWSAFYKTAGDFHSGAVIEGIAIRYYTGALNYDPGMRGYWPFVAWLVIASEFALCGGLAFRRTRAWAIVSGIVFHAVAALAVPVLSFSKLMIMLYLVLIDEKTFSAFWTRLTSNSCAK